MHFPICCASRHLFIPLLRGNYKLVTKESIEGQKALLCTPGVLRPLRSPKVPEKLFGLAKIALSAPFAALCNP
jgi:hypothetical protein